MDLSLKPTHAFNTAHHIGTEIDATVSTNGLKGNVQHKVLIRSIRNQQTMTRVGGRTSPNDCAFFHGPRATRKRMPTLEGLSIKQIHPLILDTGGDRIAMRRRDKGREGTHYQDHQRNSYDIFHR